MRTVPLVLIVIGALLLMAGQSITRRTNFAPGSRTGSRGAAIGVTAAGLLVGGIGVVLSLTR